MSQFYAKAEDEQKCRESVHARQPITITGLTNEGDIRAYTGVVQSIDSGHNRFPGYPLRITMPDASETTSGRV